VRNQIPEGQAIYAEIGRTLDIVDMSGDATDASFANRSGKAVVVESFGLAGFGYHARDEYIDTGSIVPRLYLMTRMLRTQRRPSRRDALQSRGRNELRRLVRSRLCGAA
jgi:hypothetical protein